MPVCLHRCRRHGKQTKKKWILNIITHDQKNIFSSKKNLKKNKKTQKKKQKKKHRRKKDEKKHNRKKDG